MYVHIIYSYKPVIGRLVVTKIRDYGDVIIMQSKLKSPLIVQKRSRVTIIVVLNIRLGAESERDIHR